ncbi:hypothetical protein SAMN05192574_102248 [Mucilaginibacter gossypiicola]|uniref:Uncharacterized protein n=1 Tax=Mucilaginibacter gossypiicola TaxID=551995 RepID=A0A1H8D7Y8_9SPHI|nr:hypothetical protein [Mucilaginibacter gossypiicola]SEN03441.1 hypothetical protein SAMN05192574_102248 [Mucilaginibacter gossypiicola]
MSSAFVKEGEYQKLSDVAPEIGALSFYLRQENNGQAIREIKNYYSEKCGRHVYEMSDGLTYALSDDNKWIIILEAC